ncbi:MAG TPA: c-type cytochrome biogenesis protein CcmI [Rhodoferax sp.]|nr:c-type cytochrome biogenesis protein CcmI [Rhodoferax sp.]
MIGFWVAGALAVLLVLALLFRPFLLKSQDVNVSRRQLNAAIYRDQLTRLERDRAENTLADADYEQARAELQRRVIDDTAEADANSTLQAPRKTMLAVGLVLPIAAVALYVLLGSPAALQPQVPQQAVTAQDMDRLTEGLAKKLEKEPDNLQGWAMLARSYKMLGRNMEAEMAFVRAGSFLDNDAQLLAIYADLAATNANGNFAGKPAQLIEKALKVDPENAMALWLAGTAAFRGNQFETAIRIWERLIQQVDPESEDGRMLQGSIDAAYSALGKTAPKAALQGPAKGPRVTSPEAGSPPQKTGAQASVRGRVELDASLKGKAGPNDTVMVIARAPGSRMPVAVVRANVSELPLTFTLDDSLAMSPQARISMSEQVEVEARVSKSGMAQPESGDLISAVQTVKLGASGVKIQVNKVRP